MSSCPYFLIKYYEPYPFLEFNIPILVVSTFINFVGFYLIIFQSKKETRLFKCVHLGSHLFLYLSQSFWAIFMNVAPLFPFPAIKYTRIFGTMSNDKIFMLYWGFLFLSFVAFTYSVLTVRIRIVARPKSLFRLPDWFYLTFTICSFLFGYTTSVIVLTYSVADESEMISFVTDNEKFSHCVAVLAIPGVSILTSTIAIYFAFAIIISAESAAILIYIGLSLIILYEIHRQTRKLSRATAKYQKKVAVDGIIQFGITLTFLFAWPSYSIISYFYDPGFNSRNITVICNCLFIFSPIPPIIFLMLRTESYHSYFTCFVKCSNVKPSGKPSVLIMPSVHNSLPSKSVPNAI